MKDGRIPSYSSFLQSAFCRKQRSPIPYAIRRLAISPEGTFGGGILELAIATPFLVLIFSYAMDVGLYSFRKIQLQHAMQAGIEYALSNGYGSAATISSAVTNATSFSVTASSSQFCGCPSSTQITQASAGACPLSGATKAGAVCGGGTAVYGNYVTVTAQGSYNPIIVISTNSIFGTVNPDAFNSGTQTLSASATVRIQ